MQPSVSVFNPSTPSGSASGDVGAAAPARRLGMREQSRKVLAEALSEGYSNGSAALSPSSVAEAVEEAIFDRFPDEKTKEYRTKVKTTAQALKGARNAQIRAVLLNKGISAQEVVNLDSKSLEEKARAAADKVLPLKTPALDKSQLQGTSVPSQGQPTNPIAELAKTPSVPASPSMQQSVQCILGVGGAAATPSEPFSMRGQEDLQRQSYQPTGLSSPDAEETSAALDRTTPMHPQGTGEQPMTVPSRRAPVQSMEGEAADNPQQAPPPGGVMPAAANPQQAPVETQGGKDSGVPPDIGAELAAPALLPPRALGPAPRARAPQPTTDSPSKRRPPPPLELPSAEAPEPLAQPAQGDWSSAAEATAAHQPSPAPALQLLRAARGAVRGRRLSGNTAPAPAAPGPVEASAPPEASAESAGELRRLLEAAAARERSLERRLAELEAPRPLPTPVAARRPSTPAGEAAAVQQANTRLSMEVQHLQRRLEEEKEASAARERALDERVERLEAARKELETKLVEKATAAGDEARARLLEAEAQAAAKGREVLHLKAQCEDSMSEAEKLRHDLDEVRQERDALTSRHDNLVVQCEDLSCQLQELGETAMRLEKERDGLRGVSRQLEQEKQLQRELAQRLERERDDLVRRAAEAAATAAPAVVAATKLAAQEEHLRATQEKLAKVQATLEEEQMAAHRREHGLRLQVDSMQRELDVVRRDRRGRVMGLLERTRNTMAEVLPSPAGTGAPGLAATSRPGVPGQPGGPSGPGGPEHLMPLSSLPGGESLAAGQMGTSLPQAPVTCPPQQASKIPSGVFSSEGEQSEVAFSRAFPLMSSSATENTAEPSSEVDFIPLVSSTAHIKASSPTGQHTACDVAGLFGGGEAHSGANANGIVAVSAAAASDKDEVGINEAQLQQQQPQQPQPPADSDADFVQRISSGDATGLFDDAPMVSKSTAGAATVLGASATVTSAAASAADGQIRVSGAATAAVAAANEDVAAGAAESCVHDLTEDLAGKSIAEPLCLDNSSTADLFTGDDPLGAEWLEVGAKDVAKPETIKNNHRVDEAGMLVCDDTLHRREEPEDEDCSAHRVPSAVHSSGPAIANAGHGSEAPLRAVVESKAQPLDVLQPNSSGGAALPPFPGSSPAPATHLHVGHDAAELFGNDEGFDVGLPGHTGSSELSGHGGPLAQDGRDTSPGDQAGGLWGIAAPSQPCRPPAATPARAHQDASSLFDEVPATTQSLGIGTAGAGNDHTHAPLTGAGTSRDASGLFGNTADDFLDGWGLQPTTAAVPTGAPPVAASTVSLPAGPGAMPALMSQGSSPLPPAVKPPDTGFAAKNDVSSLF